MLVVAVENRKGFSLCKFKFVKDPLPLQRIYYIDPISKSPTDNAVVKETMVRTMNVAKETGQEYAIVT